MAISPDLSGIACYAAHADDIVTISASNDISLNHASQQGYVFVLDTNTGEATSGLMKISHGENFHATNRGFIMLNDRQVLMAISYEQQDLSLSLGPRLITYDSMTNSILSD